MQHFFHPHFHFLTVTKSKEKACREQKKIWFAADAVAGEPEVLFFSVLTTSRILLLSTDYRSENAHPGSATPIAYRTNGGGNALRSMR